MKFWKSSLTRCGKKSGGNSCFEIRDVIAAVKTVNLQNLIKNDLRPVGNTESGCLIYMDSVDDDLEILYEYTE